jgi:EmrB/QacA subfamily drug resistance transporter
MKFYPLGVFFMSKQPVPLQNKLAIVAAGLLSFVGILVETSMNVTFPTLITTMHVTLATVQWLTTAYLLLVTIVMSTTAFILKRFSFRHLFFGATTVSLIGTLVALSAPNFGVLLCGRLLQAAATGISIPLMFQLIFSRIPRQQVGVYTGFASVIVSLAPALGPTYGGVLTSLWSWRAIFIGVLPLLVIIAVLGAVNIHGAALGTNGAQFDFVGLILLAATFTSIVVTFDQAGTHGWASIRFILGLIVTAGFGGATIWSAHHGKRQLFAYRILRNVTLDRRLFQYFGLQFINIGLSFVLPLYVQDVLHATPMTAGLMLLPGAIVGAFTGPIAGKYFDQHGARRPLRLSAWLATGALLLFAFATHALTVAIIAVLYTMLRIGFNSGFGTALSAASLEVSGPLKSDQNSLFSMMQQFAGSLGTSVMSAVIAEKSLHMTLTIATTRGTLTDFMILLVLALAILLVVYTDTSLRRHA